MMFIIGMGSPSKLGKDKGPNENSNKNGSPILDVVMGNVAQVHFG